MPGRHLQIPSVCWAHPWPHALPCASVLELKTNWTQHAIKSTLLDSKSPWQSPKHESAVKDFGALTGEAGQRTDRHKSPHVAMGRYTGRSWQADSRISYLKSGYRDWWFPSTSHAQIQCPTWWRIPEICLMPRERPKRKKDYNFFSILKAKLHKNHKLENNFNGFHSWGKWAAARTCADFPLGPNLLNLSVCRHVGNTSYN